jgi:hydrogenase maturation factor
MTDACDCITCGDVAVLARVIELRGQTAVVELGSARTEVAVELVEPVQVGERLLCHAGVAIARPQEQPA